MQEKGDQTYGIADGNVVGSESVRLRLDAHQERTPSSRCHAFPREVLALQAQGKSALLQVKRYYFNSQFLDLPYIP